MMVSTVCLLVALVGGDARVNAPLRSGPPVGASNDRDGFSPKFVAGPNTGKRMCPV